jgi:hypothetical protein
MPFIAHLQRPLLVALWVIVLVALAMVLLGNGMTKATGRDEQMYCTAGVLVSQGMVPYRDFAYASQLPCHPLLYAAAFRITGTTHYLLAGRLVSVACDLLVLILIVIIYRGIIPGSYACLWLGLAAAVLVAFNPLVSYASGYAWNHDVVVLLVMFSLWLLVSIGPSRPVYAWRAAAIGLCLSLAAGMRVTTILVIPLFMAALAWRAKDLAILTRGWLLPFAAGSLAAAIWPVWVFLLAPEAFWCDLVVIPAIYGRWLHEIGMAYDRLGLTRDCLTTPGYLAIFVLLAGLVILAGRRRAGERTVHPASLMVSAGLAAVFSLIAFIPPTLWPQYWAIPVPFLVVTLAWPLSRLAQGGSGGRMAIAGLLVGLAVIITVAANPLALWGAPLATDPAAWEPLKVHHLASDIVAHAEGTRRRVLTLAPLLALEGGGTIYPELSCGSIIYRVADQLTAEQRRLVRVAGPSSIVDLARANPPDVVVVGAEDRRFAFLEKPLEEVADPDWGRRDYPNGPVVYYPPRRRQAAAGLQRRPDSGPLALAEIALSEPLRVEPPSAVDR